MLFYNDGLLTSSLEGFRGEGSEVAGGVPYPRGRGTGRSARFHLSFCVMPSYLLYRMNA